MTQIFTETESQIAHRAKVTKGVVKDLKKDLFALLACVYKMSIENEKGGGFKRIIEVDEALLGKKPTYGHGVISKCYKIWVLGMQIRRVGQEVPNSVLIPVVNRNAKTMKY